MKAFALLLIIAMWLPASAAATRRVPADYPTIQAGIDAALSSLDTVLVAPGTYFENLNTRGKPITMVSEAGPAATIIDGSNPADPDSASVVYTSGGLTIEGFTITGGSGTRTGTKSFEGGGIFVQGGATIRGNWITENHVISLSDGGGISVVQGGPQVPVRILGNRIYSNSAGYTGGAAIIHVSAVYLEDNFIYDNHVSDGTGAAIYDRISNSVHLRNVYACNTTDSDEGTGGVHGCREVRNCTFVSNVGAWPALFAVYGITHNTIYAFNAGGGVSCGLPNSSCNDLYGNTPFDVGPGCPLIIGQNGNISVGPAFGDADSCAATYCLSPGSPLLPENSPPGCGLIGAHGECEVLAIDALTSPDFAAGPLLARPNPLNPQTTLTFVLSESRHVEVNIVDARGRVVRTLVNQTMPQGQHDVTWDGRDGTGREVASGAYIAVLKSPSARLSQKLLLLK